MGQVTIYLDEKTEKKMNNMVKKSGVSKSKWIAELIREKTDSFWPESVSGLAGAWKDFPEAEDIRQSVGQDIDRIKI